MSALGERLNAALADRYRIERELGSGGMAIVYLAEDLKHGRSVALKVLRPELGAAIGPERFLREIETVARLAHPHILPLFDSGEADGLLYYVMPYVRGKTLRERLDQEAPLSLDATLRIVEQVAGALTQAHEHGVIHRDVKPANILFEAGQALVSDFGIARAVDVVEGERMTRTGIAVGTPTYMSPEQAVGDTVVDARSDVYSLACVTYEMLSGHPPFAAPTPAGVLARHAADLARPVDEVRPDVPPGVGRALARALATDPADRYASATDFAEALAGAATAQAVAAEEARARRARWVRRLGVAAGLAFLAASGWWLSTLVGGPSIDRLAVLPFTNLTNDPEQEYLVLGVHQALITELAQAGIPVIARTSVMRFANANTPIREIATELDVDAVLEGTIMPSGDSLALSTGLIDARTEAPLWSGSHAAALSNVLGLYRDVAESVVSEIRGSLTPEQEARLAERPRIDAQAYQAYMRGVVHSERFTAEDLSTALEYFERALAIDPGYAEAHLGIASVWASRAISGVVSGPEARQQGESHLRRALALDSTLAEAHKGVADFVAFTDRDWDAGEAGYRRAIELDPGAAEARALYAHLLSILGRWDEAREQADAALALDPLNPFIQRLYGVQLWLARRFEDAIEVFEEANRRDPGAGFARSPLADALRRVGREDEAFQIVKDSYELRGASGVVAALESGFEAGGFAEAWGAAADTMAANPDTGFYPPTQIAVFYARSGDLEAALDWVERAAEARDPNVPYLGVVPPLEPLHDEPRFRALVQRLGLAIREGPGADD